MRFPWSFRSVQWLINVSLATFGVLITIVLVVQGKLSQGLIEHPVWQQVLESSTRSVLHSSRSDFSDTLPTKGVVKGWLVIEDKAPPADMPSFLVDLAPGYYRESELNTLVAPSIFALSETSWNQNIRSRHHR